MSELRKVDSDALWGQSAQKINDNFDFLSTDVERIHDATSRNKGYFATEESLLAMYGEEGISPIVGDKAYVGESYPYHVYQYTEEGWKDRGVQTEGDERVELSDYYTKQEANAIFLGWQDEPETIKTVEATLVETAIRKTPQVLTEEEQSVARGNISALGLTELGKLNILVWE